MRQVDFAGLEARLSNDVFLGSEHEPDGLGFGVAFI